MIHGIIVRAHNLYLHCCGVNVDSIPDPLTAAVDKLHRCNPPAAAVRETGTKNKAVSVNEYF